MDDQELNRWLREWKAPDAPPHLRPRPARASWLGWLATGAIRVPVPVALGALVLAALWSVAVRPEPLPAPETSAPRRSGELARYALTGPLQGFDAVLIELNFQPGRSAPEHRHPGPIVGYVVDGRMRTALNREQEQIVPAGGTFFEPSGALHSAFGSASPDAPVRIVAFMVVPTGSPLTSPAAAQTPPGPRPYKAVHNPDFVPASEATFLQDDDILLGVASGKEAKAFPAADLAQHGAVFDQLPDGPISVTWCGVCNTGLVFRAEVKGRTLHFQYDRMVGGNEVQKDLETGTSWQQASGEAIDGPLKGTRLKLYPPVRTTWAEWRKWYPHTLVLKPLPEYVERMPILSRRIKDVTRVGPAGAPNGALALDPRLPPRETVAGLEVGRDTVAYPFSQLRIARVVNDRVGGLPIPHANRRNGYAGSTDIPRIRGGGAATSIFFVKQHRCTGTSATARRRTGETRVDRSFRRVRGGARGTEPRARLARCRPGAPSSWGRARVRRGGPAALCHQQRAGEGPAGGRHVLRAVWRRSHLERLCEA